MEIKRVGPGEDSLVMSSQHLFDGAARPDAVRRFLGDPHHHLLLALDGAAPVGFVSGVELTHPDKGVEMFLYELAVDEPHRRRGVATALVEALAALASERGCYDMWVLTDFDNDAALGTYLKTGATERSSHEMLTWQFPLSPLGRGSG